MTPAAARTPWDVLRGRAAGWRQGPVAAARAVPATLADPPVVQWVALPDPFTTGSTSGGAGRTEDAASAAAIAEALERLSAARHPLHAVADPAGPRWSLDEFSLHSPAQRAADGYPYLDGWRAPGYTRLRSLPSNEPVWAPAGLVGLRPEHGLPSTSTGLAAAPSAVLALLRAVQELVERDAFAIAWLHGVRPPRVAHLDPDTGAPLDPDTGVLLPPDPGARLGPDTPTAPARAVSGGPVAFDLTPAWSPHPVAAVLGALPVNGVPRPTLGLACRATWDDAITKAWLEWAQGTAFVTVRTDAGARVPSTEAADVTDFDRHALHWTGRPAAEWAALPALSGAAGAVPAGSATVGAAAQLRELVDTLTGHGVRLAYREVTGPEAAAVGLRVVRVVSPELVPLHADHRWPHLGGTCADVDRRFPGMPRAGRFPSPAPHPLG